MSPDQAMRVAQAVRRSDEGRGQRPAAEQIAGAIETLSSEHRRTNISTYRHNLLAAIATLRQIR